MHSSTYREQDHTPITRVNALRAKHNEYKQRVKEARMSPSTTDFYLAQLKKEKLAVKEQLEGIKAYQERYKKAS